MNNLVHINAQPQLSLSLFSRTLGQVKMKCSLKLPCLVREIIASESQCNYIIITHGNKCVIIYVVVALHKLSTFLGEEVNHMCDLHLPPRQCLPKSPKCWPVSILFCIKESEIWIINTISYWALRQQSNVGEHVTLW